MTMNVLSPTWCGTRALHCITRGYFLKLHVLSHIFEEVQDLDEYRHMHTHENGGGVNFCTI